ncbi:MAG: hypothetical protein AABZ32_06365 [Bacteroidota bacterium]
MTAKDSTQVSTNYDRDEGSNVVLEERTRLMELRKRSMGKESCIVFFCKDCDKITPVTKVNRRYSYTCNVCGTRNVAFGTEVSIRKFFHLPDTEVAEECLEGSKA